MRSLSTVASGIAKQDANIQATLADLPPALVEFRKTFEKFSVAANSFAQIAIELGPQDEASRKALAGKTPSELRKTIAEAQKAMTSINATAEQLNRLVTDVKGPLKSFSNSGLTELSMTLRDIRQLVANFNVIATKLERDPAGFVYSGKQGYTPK